MNQATIDPATMVLHELRAPLGLMATAARSAADDCQDDDLRVRCEMIVRAAEGMLRTANQVFQINRVAASGEPAMFRPFEVASQLVETLRGFDVRVSLHGEPDARRAAVFGVYEQFEALLHSLVTNAMDHSELGAPVHVGLLVRDGGLLVEIRNVPARRARHRGLGLGTAIADALAERMGAVVERKHCGSQYLAGFELKLASAG